MRGWSKLFISLFVLKKPRSANQLMKIRNRLQRVAIANYSRNESGKTVKKTKN